jgi:hypothetical protein
MDDVFPPDAAYSQADDLDRGFVYANRRYLSPVRIALGCQIDDRFDLESEGSYRDSDLKVCVSSVNYAEVLL